MKSILVIGILLIAAMLLSSQAFSDIPYGTAVIDGDLSEWANATWFDFDTNYDSNPTDIVGGGWTARWTPTKIYVAVKVQDTAHAFTNSYTGWDARDALEIYIHTTGSGGDYSTFQEPAQQWVTGFTAAADGTLWTSITSQQYTVNPDQYMVLGHIDGDWLYYEMSITPYEYFGGLRGNPDVISPLSDGDTIGLDVTACANSGAAYTGMKCARLNQVNIGSWWADYSLYATHTLGPTTYTASASVTLGDFSGDMAGIPVNVVMTDTSNNSESIDTVLDSTGKFTISGILSDTYTVTIKPSKWLRYAVPISLPITSDIDFGNVGWTFINGDCDGDNEITSTDLSVILGAMDALEGDPTWDPTADLDGDGEITSTDLSIVLANMDMLGD